VLMENRGLDSRNLAFPLRFPTGRQERERWGADDCRKKLMSLARYRDTPDYS
jgi:hypothetical protein